MALGIQKRTVVIIPKPIDPKMVEMREVSNLHMRNFIVTRGADEFWIAKRAIAATINNINQ